jgi:hypothetical protein
MWNGSCWVPASGGCSCGCNPCQCQSGVIQPCPPQFACPPVTFACQGPIIGVTDGSLAQAGEVGQLIGEAHTGTVTSNNPGGTVPAITLPPGDWVGSSSLFIGEQNPGAGVFFTNIELQILNGTTQMGVAQVWGNWATGSGLAGGTFNTQSFHLSVAVSTLLTGQVTTTGYTAGVPANFTVSTLARRVR